MKKKIFTLLTLALVAIGTVQAGDVYKITFNGSNAEFKNGEEVAAGTFFSWNSSKHNFNTKFNGCTYDGINYSSGLKMESATKVSWTSTATSTVTIVQSTWSANTIKLDGTELAIADASTDIDGCRVYTIADVAAGEHSMTRGSSESGVFAIYVEYTGASMTQLAAPEITVNAANGEVTIGAVANASKVTYTTDGSDPTDESTEYTAAFTVEDGVTIKAIAIGDGVSYITSTITSKVAYIDGITVAEPTINQYNGTVALACTTPGATIEYSTDNVTFTAYTRAFTLSEDATVYARASRENCTTSSVASAAVTTIGKGAATKTIWMGLGSFDSDNANKITGKEGDDAEGIVMQITSNTDKKYSSGGAKIKIGDIERTTIKLSNGAQNTITLPDGMKATRITFYSFINSAPARTSYWKEFNGENISGADVPMGAWNNVADYLTNPDVRSFALNGDETSITFTNAGEQLCFIIALNVEVPVTATIASSGLSTYANENAIDCANLPTGLTAWQVTSTDDGKATLKQVTSAVEAGTGLILQGTPNETYTLPVVATGSKLSDNKLKGAVYATTIGNQDDTTDYVLNGGKFVKADSGTLKAGKAYLRIANTEAAELAIDFGGATSISEELRAKSEGLATTPIYNLNGQRVAQPTKGLYIVNGRKVVIK